MPAGQDVNIPIGVYRGAVPDIAPIQAYEQFLGMPDGTTVDYVLAFMADSPTWAQFEAGTLQSRTNGPAGSSSASDWAPLLGGRKLMLGVPACVQGTTWAEEASGANDAHWTALANNLQQAFPGGVHLRIAREMNTGYQWHVIPATAADHRAGWSRIVSTMKAAGAPGNRYYWNPMIGQGSMGPSHGIDEAYPGNSAVDAIGLDYYDWGYAASAEVTRTSSERASFWAKVRDEWDGLTGWRSFAASHGKPLAFPEWGLKLWGVGNSYDGGGDDDYFVNEMARFIKSLDDPGNPQAMHAFWEDPNQGVSDPDSSPGRRIAVPAARAAFLAAFGYSA